MKIFSIYFLLFLFTTDLQCSETSSPIKRTEFWQEKINQEQKIEIAEHKNSTLEKNVAHKFADQFQQKRQNLPSPHKKFNHNEMYDSIALERFKNLSTDSTVINAQENTRTNCPPLHYSQNEPDFSKFKSNKRIISTEESKKMMQYIQAGKNIFS